jgi:hypothetical protein
MLRKTILALAASAALGVAALAPTSASAFGWHGGWGWGPGFRVYIGGQGYYGGCMVRRVFYTPYGPVVRWVNRCY